MPRRGAGLLADVDNPGEQVDLPRRLRRDARRRWIEMRRAAGEVVDSDEEMDDAAQFDDEYPAGDVDMDDDDDTSIFAHGSESDDDDEGLVDIQGDEEDIAAAEELDMLPAGFDQQELAAAQEYGDGVDQDNDVEVTAFVEDEDAGAQDVPGVAPAMIEPLADDISVLVPHQQNQFIDMGDFEMALGLYAHIYGVNRTEYAALCEVMKLLRQQDGRPLPEVSRLPNQLATLKSRISKRFPLLDMRKAKVPLRVEKLPTERATRKQEEQGEITADLHILDPVSLFQAFLSSDVGQSMHQGMAHFVDEPTELFHSHSWASSARATSGAFAHIHDSDGYEIDIILPSDFVVYRCGDESCACSTATPETPGMAHIGRVYGVGKDYRTDHCTPEAGGIALQIQEAFGTPDSRAGGLYPAHPMAGDEGFEQDDDELLLSFEHTTIREAYLLLRVTDNVAVDYYWGETMADPATGAGQSTKQNFPKYTHQPQVDMKVKVVRRMVRDMDVVPLCHSHPIRAELEIATYGREMFEDWDNPDTTAVISCPIMVFIDGFGVYRNSYRSLIGVYAIPATLTGDDRSRPANIFPLTLSPHGSNFDDTVKALQCLAQLDKGVEVDINNERRIMCVPTLCYLGDMPQQNANSGFRGPLASKFCRFCMVGQELRKSGNPSDVLDFDIVTHGRYHHQTLEMRKELNAMQTKKDRQQYGSQWGVAEGGIDGQPALSTISPALDLVLSRPPDPAHSEYQGMASLMHNLLVDRVLSETGKLSYAKKLRTWPFPPGWERLQSPLHHLKSYSLSGHARWSIIVPTLLRSWLAPQHLHKHFAAEGQRRLGSVARTIEFVVDAYACLARSNCLLMGLKISADDRANMGTTIRTTRDRYQDMCQLVSKSIVDNPLSYRAFSRESSVQQQQSRAGSRSASTSGQPGLGLMLPPPLPLTSRARASPAPSMASSVGEPARAARYASDQTRPNVHTGVHYTEMAEEYGVPANTNVLACEGEHRWMKKKVYETNHSNIEKHLLMKVNMQVTLRLLLRNGFFWRDAELTTQIDKLYNNCPTLFDAVLPRSDRRDMTAEEDDYELDVSGSVDRDHQRSTVIGHVSVKAIGHHETLGQPLLPTKPHRSSDTFQALLRKAYTSHYRIPDIWVFSGLLQWSNKFGFTDRDLRRYVFTRGHYVQFDDGDGSGEQLGQVDQIFIHEYDGTRYIFIVLTPMELLDEQDPILQLPKVRALTDKPVIVGLNAIRATKPYIVTINDDCTVWVRWQLEWL